eukprot:11587198-Alexandrium_andersonii.AAC.1
MRELPATCNGTCQRRMASTRHECATRHTSTYATQLTPKGLRRSKVTSNPWEASKLPPCDCDAHR